jgi:hypothetical protein
MNAHSTGLKSERTQAAASAAATPVVRTLGSGEHSSQKT